MNGFMIGELRQCLREVLAITPEQLEVVDARAKVPTPDAPCERSGFRAVVVERARRR